MFAAAGKLVIRKPFYRLKDLWKAYKADHREHGATSPFVVHFRWATHGNGDVVNIHPHPICGDKVGLVHNGILNCDPPLSSGISDTVYFCRTVLAHRQPSFVLGHRCNSWLAELIGPSNKFVMMDGRGNVSIVNSTSGEWLDGCWFSNVGHRTPARKAKLSDSLFTAPGDTLELDLATKYLRDIGINPLMASLKEWDEAFRETRIDLPDYTLDIDKSDERAWREACCAADRDTAAEDPAGWGRILAAKK